LKPGGWLLFEMGYRSEPGIRAALGPEWQELETGYDLAGLPRVLLAGYISGSH
jgi:release factor glutamine methyltransferase